MACLLGSQSAGMAPALETGTIEQVGLTRGKPHIGWPRVLMTGLLGLSRHVATVHAECDAFSTGKSPALKHSKAGHHSLGQNLPIGSKVLDPSGPEVHLLFAAVAPSPSRRLCRTRSSKTPSNGTSEIRHWPDITSGHDRGKMGFEHRIPN